MSAYAPEPSVCAVKPQPFGPPWAMTLVRIRFEIPPAPLAKTLIAVELASVETAVTLRREPVFAALSTSEQIAVSAATTMLLENVPSKIDIEHGAPPGSRTTSWSTTAYPLSIANRSGYCWSISRLRSVDPLAMLIPAWVEPMNRMRGRGL